MIYVLSNVVRFVMRIRWLQRVHKFLTFLLECNIVLWKVFFLSIF